MREHLPVVRAARNADLTELVRLCGAHAKFERAAIEEDGLAERLEVAIFGPHPCLWAWVIEAEDGMIRGYATATREFSTWSGRAYLHMDCLFVEECLRGEGNGRRLMDAVRSAAREASLSEIQWQTPGWNAAAIRFYNRQGASGTPKVRFTARL